MNPTDPYRYFRVEAKELLDVLVRAVVKVERGAADAETSAGMFRAAHTLKGAARVVRLPEIAERAHQLEDALAPLRDDPSASSRAEIAGRALATLDAIAVLLAELPAAAGAVETAGGKTSAARGSRADAAPDRLDANDLDRALAALGETESAVAEFAVEAATLAGVRDAAERLAARARRDATAAALACSARDGATRVSRAVDAFVAKTSIATRTAREVATALRLRPARTLFAGFERAVRDAAAALGKRVRFVGIGEDVRVDEGLAAAVEGPLIQLARNAVAHGVENAAERRAAGKSEEGLVEASVRREYDDVVFTCRDDGRGFDFDAARRAIAERDGLAPAEAAALEEGDLLRRLLRGGVSTATRATHHAGRGVGLDVVRAAAEGFRGEVAIESTRGVGAVVTIRAPADLAAERALVVTAGGATCAIAVSRVRRVEGVRARAGDGRTPFAPPYATLADLVGRAAQEGIGDRTTAVVVAVDDGRGDVTVAVDRVVGLSTLTYAPYPAWIAADGVVAGSAPGPGGAPVLFLDADAVARLARSTKPREVPPPPPPPRVLVVDDSLTTRMLETSILESAGMFSHAVDSAAAALEALAAAAYDVVLADVEMPGMDGFELATRVKSDPSLRRTPIVLVTSREAPADRLRAREVGADGYMSKRAFDQKALLDVVRRLAAAGRAKP